jgi:hypothetical protein
MTSRPRLAIRQPDPIIQPAANRLAWRLAAALRLRGEWVRVDIPTQWKGTARWADDLAISVGPQPYVAPIPGLPCAFWLEGECELEGAGRLEDFDLVLTSNHQAALALQGRRCNVQALSPEAEPEEQLQAAVSAIRALSRKLASPKIPD